MRSFILISMLFSSLCLSQGCGPAGPSGPPACVPDNIFLCEGESVFEIDSCTNEKSEVQACARECRLGACVDCLPSAGVVCDGDNVAVTNSCGLVEETIQTCENGCADGACLPATCEPDDERICDENRVVSVDSCGNVREVVGVCPEERPCDGGFCDGCGVPEELGCFDGDLYEYDACGERLGRAEVCDDSCDGVNQVCGNEECTLNVGVVCHEGNLHFRDSCFNVQEELQSACEAGCDDQGCKDDCLERVVGRVCLKDDVYALTRECEDDRPQVTAIIESCPSGCRGGRCAVIECRDDAGVVCDGDNVRALDSCGEDGEIVERCDNGCENGACISE